MAIVCMRALSAAMCLLPPCDHCVGGAIAGRCTGANCPPGPDPGAFALHPCQGPFAAPQFGPSSWSVRRHPIATRCVSSLHCSEERYWYFSKPKQRRMCESSQVDGHVQSFCSVHDSRWQAASGDVVHCCYRVQVVLDAIGNRVTSTEVASNITSQQSKAAAGNQPQLFLHTTSVVSSALPAVQPGLSAFQPGPTAMRPTLPARAKAQATRTAQPTLEASTVQQEQTVPSVPNIIVPAARAPAVSPIAGMPGGDNVHDCITQEPARYVPQHRH